MTELESISLDDGWTPSDIERLERWKLEAMQVLGNWELVWEAAGKPGPLGVSKAQAVHDLIERLRFENERLWGILADTRVHADVWARRCESAERDLRAALDERTTAV